MKVLFLIAFRNLRYRKEKTLFSILAIAMGIATVIAVFTLDYNTILSQKQEKAGAYGRPDFEVKPIKRGKAAFSSLFILLQKEVDAQHISPIFFSSVTLSGNNFSNKEILLCGFSPDMNKHFKAYSLASGRNIASHKQNEILLNEVFAKKNNIALGCVIWLKQAESISRKCVEGREFISIKSNTDKKTYFHVVGLIKNTALGRSRHGNVGIIPFREGIRALPFPALSPFFWVKLSSKNKDIVSMLTSHAIVTPPAYAMISESFQEKAFRNGVRISGILSLAMGFFVVFSTLSMSLMEKITEVGLLKTIGLTDRQLSVIFMLEALFMSVLGSVLGFFLGISLAYILGRLHITTLGMGKAIYTFKLPLKQIIGIMVLGVVVDLAGALFPLFKARKMAPAKAMMPAPMEVEVQTYKGFGMFILILLLGILPAAYFYLAPLLKTAMFNVVLIQGVLVFMVFMISLVSLPFLHKQLSHLMFSHLPTIFKAEGILAARSIKGSPYRIISTLIGLMLIVAAMLTLKSMTASLKGEIVAWGNESLHNKLFVTFKAKQERGKAIKLLSSPLVKSVTPMSAAINSPFLIYGIKFDNLRKDYANTVNMPDDNSQHIVISKELARKMKYKVGDSIPLPTYRGKVTFNISAISDKFGFFPAERSYGVIDEQYMEDFFCRSNDSASKFVVKLRNGVSYGEWVKDILERKKDIYKEKGSFISRKKWDTLFSVETSDEVLRAYVVDLMSDFVLFDIILVMVGFLVGVGNVNSLLIGTLERKREIALLRAVGLTGEQIFKTLIIEGLFIGLIGGILGIIEGLPFAYIVVSGLKHMSNMALPFVFPLLWIKYALFASVSVSILSGLYPAYRMRNFSVIKSLQYE